MGSRITRALSQTDRQRRPPSQHQARQLIKIMCSSLMGILVFFVGFLNTHAGEAHRHWLQYLAMYGLCAVLMNLANPQSMLAVGWVLVMLQSLLAYEYTAVLFNIGACMVHLAIATNIYGYYSNRDHPQPYKFLLPCVLLLIGHVLSLTSDCCSHLIKQLRAQAKSIAYEQEHHLGLRVLFCLMGLMMVMLCVMGHAYVRRGRFVPASLREQGAWLRSVGLRRGAEVVLGSVAVKLVVMGVLAGQCTGTAVMQQTVLSGGVLLALAYSLHYYLCHHSPAAPHLLPLATLISLALHLLAASLPSSLPLLLLLLLPLFALISHPHRLSYLLALMLACLHDTNPGQYSEGVLAVVTGCLVVGSVGLGWVTGRRGRYELVAEIGEVGEGEARG